MRYLVRRLTATPTWKHLIELLYLWQAQTGAAFALAAAVLGAIVIPHQTGTTRRLEETRRTRRADTLRAVLPLILTELADYAANCAGFLPDCSRSQIQLASGLRAYNCPRRQTVWPAD